MKKNIYLRLRVKAGFENPTLGLHYGEQFVYYLMGYIDGFKDQAIVMNDAGTKIIPGININCFDVVPSPKMVY